MTTLRKIISLFLIICFVGTISGSVLFYPQKTEGVYMTVEWGPVTKATEGAAIIGTASASVTAASTKTAEYTIEKLTVENIVSALMLAMAHQLAAQMTNEIIRYIQTDGASGFFSEGFGNFLVRGADNAVGAFIDQYLGAGYLCEPFDLDIKLMLLADTNFATEARCSVSDMLEAQGHTLEDFWSDFSNGGFAAFIETTKPQNNFYGAAFRALREATEIESEAEEELKFDATLGQGYLSIKECKWYDKNGRLIDKQTVVGVPPPYPPQCTGAADAPGVAYPCTRDCVVITPGSTIAETVNLALAQPYERLNQVMGAMSVSLSGYGKFGYGVYLAAITDALINWVFKKGYGLLRAPFETAPDQPDYTPRFPGDPSSGELPGGSGTGGGVRNGSEFCDDESLVVNNTSNYTFTCSGPGTCFITTQQPPYCNGNNRCQCYTDFNENNPNPPFSTIASITGAGSRCVELRDDTYYHVGAYGERMTTADVSALGGCTGGEGPGPTPGSGVPCAEGGTSCNSEADCGGERCDQCYTNLIGGEWQPIANCKKCRGSGGYCAQPPLINSCGVDGEPCIVPEHCSNPRHTCDQCVTYPGGTPIENCMRCSGTSVVCTID